jgi:hypothetical protein
MGGAEGMRPGKVLTRDLVLAFLVTASGALFFLSVSRVISGVALSTWIIPSVLAIIFCAFLFVFAVTSSVKRLSMPITIIAFLPSIIFIPVITHISVTVIAMIITIYGLYEMRHALFNMLRIDMSAVIRSGISYVSIALIIVVTSQYYFSIRDNSTNVIFDATEHVQASNMIADLLLSQSGIENVSIETMTVNDFLGFLADNAYEKKTQGPIVAQEDTGLIIRWANNAGIDLEKIEDDAQGVAIAQMRDNLGSILDRDLTGEEQMVDIFAAIIERQINTIMEQNELLRNYNAEIFSVMLFLILFSLASILRILASWLARFMFFLLRELKIVHVVRIQRDAEVIEMR